MKTITVIIAFLFASTILADEPLLQEGLQIKDGLLPLNKGPYSVPAVADWNNDGAKDLIVGQWNDGHIHLFLNQGTDLNPAFNGSTLIEAAGQPITTTHL